MHSQLNPTKEQQQLFVLNMLANVNSGLVTSGKTPNDVQLLVDCTNNIELLLKDPAIKAIVGEWELVWGPYISYSQMNISPQKAKEHAEFVTNLKKELGNNSEESHALEQSEENDFSSLGLEFLTGLSTLTSSHNLETSNSFIDKGSNHLVTDNLMYAIQCKKQPDGVQGPNYFIGIAGTNSVSPFGWFKEDFDVKNMKTWTTALDTFGISLPNGGEISTASWQGLQQLWNMGQANPHITKEEKARGRGYGTPSRAEQKTLWGFIQSLHNETIAVSGHSLGGALAPVLATALANLSTNEQLNNQFKVLSTAGPTAGNASFVKHVNDSVDDYQVIYNKIDVVPQAWIKDDLVNAHNFYPSNFSFDEDKFPLSTSNLIVKNVLLWASKRPKHQNQFARKFSETIPQIKTWDEGKLPIVPNSSLANTLTDAVGKLRLGLTFNALNSLKKINNNKYPSKQELNEFAAYLLYLGLQHVLAYSGKNGFAVENAMNTMNTFLKKYKESHGLPQGKVAKLTLFEVLVPLIKTIAK